MKSRYLHGSMAALPRRIGAIVALVGMAGLLNQCNLDRQTGAGSPTLISIGLRPTLPPNFSFFANNLTIDQVRLTLIRPPSEILARVTRPLALDSSAVRFAVTAVLQASPESLLAVVDYQTAQGVTLFTGQVTVVAATGAPVPTQPIVPLTYSGPGLNIAALSLSPVDDTLSPGDSLSYQISAIDSSQQPVPSFYVSWTTDDPKITINPLGLVVAPDLSRRVNVIALTPNGTSTQTTLTVLSTSLGVLPDSVEKLPNGQQQFAVQVGSPGPYIWSVNGIDGGNATFGTIDTSGFYVAPAAVPSPANFQVCARVAAAPTTTGCAKVVITQVPSAGGDVIVFNDINLFTPFATVPGNTRLIRNLVSFASTGSRANSKVVLFDYSHGSRCAPVTDPPGCDFGLMQPMRSIIAGQGMSVDTVGGSATLTNIPIQVKVIFMWTPMVPYDTTEINSLKLFAAQGGRIVFLGERLPYYTSQGIDSVENRFFLEMGAQLVNIGADAALDLPYIVPIPAAGRHQIMTGVDSVAFSAASIIVPGPNDFVLVQDTTRSADVLGAVAKIDLTALPTPRYHAHGQPVRRQPAAPEKRTSTTAEKAAMPGRP